MSTRSRSRNASRLPDVSPPPRRHPFRSLARAVSWHRRKLAVLAAVATVLCALTATAPPAPPTSPVVRARSALPGGAVLRTADLETVELAREGLPEETVADASALVGQRLSAPVASRTVLTSLSVVSTRSLAGSGRVLAPVRIADPAVVALLRPGEVVDVLATDPQSGQASTVARRLRVVTVPVADDGTGQQGALVLLDAAAADTEPLAQAAATGSLTVTWS